MTKEYYFKKTLVVMVASFVLSGCSMSKGSKSRHIHQKPIANEIIKPLSKPIEAIAFNTQIVPANSYVLNQNKSLKIDISEYGYSRFFIEDEKITDVFVYPQDGVQAKINQPGYLIIVPNQLQETQESDDSSDDTVYVTITGEQGTTQDFFLRFTGKAPEPVKFVKSILGQS